MWGINLFAVVKIISGVGISSALLGKHGSINHLTRKIKLYASEQHAEAAKSIVFNVARQDKSLFEKLKKELFETKNLLEG